MNQIKVLAFGAIKDIIKEDNLIIKDIDSTDKLVHYLEQKYPLIKTIKYAIAVDKKVINNNTVLHQNATVAILPPFSGG